MLTHLNLDLNPISRFQLFLQTVLSCKNLNGQIPVTGLFQTR